MAQAKKKANKKAETKKAGGRKQAAGERVNFEELHRMLDRFAQKLSQISSTSPKHSRILSAIWALKSETNCQTTMVIQF